jgi:two-component system, OmpR family, KDP operon response regulator KdpE
MSNPARVLIVEDHDVTRETLSMLLEKEGFSLRAGGSMAEAYACFEAEPPHVALVDVGLPDGNGLDLVNGFLERDPKVRVIVVTASDQKGLAKEALQRGAFSFIHKPYGFRDLLSVVQRALKEE